MVEKFEGGEERAHGEGGERVNDGIDDGTKGLLRNEGIWSLVITYMLGVR